FERLDHGPHCLGGHGLVGVALRDPDLAPDLDAHASSFSTRVPSHDMTAATSPTRTCTTSLPFTRMLARTLPSGTVFTTTCAWLPVPFVRTCLVTVCGCAARWVLMVPP